MAANYDTQILAMVAAAFINVDGSTAITYGCEVTRNDVGVYTLILPTGEGIIDEQCFIRVTAKATGVATGTNTPVFIVATNLADTFSKQLNCFSNASGSPADSDLEIVVQRTVTYPLDTTTPEF